MKKYANKILIALIVIVIICIIVEVPFLVDARKAEFEKHRQLHIEMNSNKPMQ